MRIEVSKVKEMYDKMVSEDSMQAFDAIYHALYAPMFSFACKITGNYEIGEEVIADVFTQFWLSRKKIVIDNVVTYFYVAVRNRALTSLKKEKQRQEISLDEIDFEIAAYRYNPEMEFISKEEVKKINQAMEALPPRCKMALLLVREHGLKYKEVAEVMGVSVKTVETQIARALKKMAQILGVNLENPEKSGKLQSFLLCL